MNNFTSLFIGCGFGYYFLYVISPDFEKSIQISQKNDVQSITVNQNVASFPSSSRTINYDAIWTQFYSISASERKLLTQFKET